LLAASLALGAVLAAGAAPSATPEPTLAQLIGQRLVVRMDGSAPSASLLARARRGEIGGVIVFGFNFSSAGQLRSITRELQQAAARGGRPKLLIAVDQEGGAAKTVETIPPTRSARQLGALGSAPIARREGRNTGEALRALGINTDLAPVADVPTSTGSFMYRQGRTWSFDVATTTRLAWAFAAGLRDGGAIATMKHFPGIGRATRSTDRYVVRLAASRSRLAPELEPYRRAIARGVPLIMLSNSVYTAYDRANAAGWSSAIATTLLRRELGYRGATITDSLDGAAHARGVPTDVLAIRAARAGADLILVTGSEAASRSVYLSVLRAARDGRLGLPRLLASYRRILALKRGL
jgi:beta-N-acetylhexosaminidase